MRAAKIRPDELAREQARARARVEAERVAAEREERKLLKELADEDAKLAEAAQVIVPPETPQERRVRELEERLARYEGREAALAAGPVSYNATAERRQYARRDALRILRAKRDNREATRRSEAHTAACRRELDQLDAQTEECARQLDAEDQRHSEAVAELSAERRRVDRTREAILKPLGADETSEERLAAVFEEVAA